MADTSVVGLGRGGGELVLVEEDPVLEERRNALVRRRQFTRVSESVSRLPDPFTALPLSFFLR